MERDRILRAARAALLTALLLFFAGSLVHTLLQQDRARGHGRLPPSPGQDPGLRVLVLNRPQLLDRAPPKGARTFDVLYVQALVPLELVSPDAPADPEMRARLRAGGRLMIKPELNSGLILSSADFDRGPKELMWTVSRVWLLPGLSATTAESAERAGRDPAVAEAPGGATAFAIGKNRYRGALEIRWAGSKEIAAVNCLPIEASWKAWSARR
jgi:hypothetical protein